MFTINKSLEIEVNDVNETNRSPLGAMISYPVLVSLYSMVEYSDKV